MTDASAKLGENIAAGQIVYQNDLMQLIHCADHENGAEGSLLIVPPGSTSVRHGPAPKTP